MSDNTPRFFTGLGMTVVLLTTVWTPTASAQGPCPVVPECTHADWTLRLPPTDYADGYGPQTVPYPGGIQLSVPQFDPAQFSLLEGVPEELIELVAVELTVDTTVRTARIWYKNDHPTSSCSMDWSYDLTTGLLANPAVVSPQLEATVSLSGSTGNLAPGQEYQYLLPGPVTESECISWRVQDHDLSPWVGNGIITFDVLSSGVDIDTGNCGALIKSFENETSVTATATYYYCVSSAVVMEETVLGCFPTTPVACQSLQPLDWGIGGVPPGVISVPKFDSGKGDLLSVEVVYKAQYVGQVCADNPNPACCLVAMSSELVSIATASAGNHPPVTNIGPFVLDDSTGLTPPGFLLGSSDGVTDECATGPVGNPSAGDCTPGEDHVLESWDVTFETAPQSVTAPADLLPWIDHAGLPDTVELDTSATGTLVASFCASIDVFFSAEARVWVEVTYSYLPGASFCFGDPGSGIPCPCGNDNDGSVPGSGCDNGAFASGAHLTRSGVARVGTDMLVLHTSGLEPNNAGLYFQAEHQISGGDGSWWGDGLRCAGGNLRRLGVRFSDSSGYSDTSGLPLPISVRAGNVMPGDVKHYQFWFRTQQNPPCGVGVNDFNTSNGISVIWLP